ncbi:type II toxin-antitoxin system VapC family toxin [Sphingomonas sp. TDK1]|uniref:type II toxin-antitoxin system VapC family toxin n=1 Tax=Sphingomonas sp. TDK1 TaxID=453247 RepID=UPI0007D8FBDE|nr:type II toxin-antitoxin system VapC family toxin [Sphingomonas sp. TDK1]OAN64798.1 twitching motility protein PilT [Sphingomonas sp. TDK1]
MTLFVDASAMVAIIAEEPERDRLVVEAVEGAPALWSAMAAWETVAALSRSREMNITAAHQEAALHADQLGLTLVPIGARELELALDAYQQFGKGRHPAGLNMGDCFAYACAKSHDARLLYKGDDFSKTDLA